MPNSINRRRFSTPATEASAEVEALKEQLSALRQLYLQDMANVSNDMRILNEQLTQVAPSAVEANSVTDASAASLTSTDGSTPLSDPAG